MAPPQRRVTITARELTNFIPPASLLTLSEPAIVIDADVPPMGTATIVDIELITTVRPTVVLHAGFLVAALGEASFGVVRVVVQGLFAEVVDADGAVLALRPGCVREVDDAVFDDVALDSHDGVGLLAAQDVAVGGGGRVVQGDLAEVVGLDKFAVMLNQGLGDREVDFESFSGFVVEVVGDSNPFGVIAGVVVLKFSHLVGRDVDLLVPDEFDGVVWQLVVKGVDKSGFELGDMSVQ